MQFGRNNDVGMRERNSIGELRTTSKLCIDPDWNNLLAHVVECRYLHWMKPLLRSGDTFSIGARLLTCRMSTSVTEANDGLRLRMRLRENGFSWVVNLESPMTCDSARAWYRIVRVCITGS